MVNWTKWDECINPAHKGPRKVPRAFVRGWISKSFKKDVVLRHANWCFTCQLEEREALAVIGIPYKPDNWQFNDELSRFKEAENRPGRLRDNDRRRVPLARAVASEDPVAKSAYKAKALCRMFKDKEHYGDLMNYAVFFPVSIFIHQTMEFATTSCKFANVFVCPDCQQPVRLHMYFTETTYT